MTSARFMRSFLVCSAVLFLLFVLAGCGVHKPFALLDENTQIRKGSIAVIAGDDSEATVVLANHLTQELRERSTFRVISQQDIGRKVGKYPIVIKNGDPDNWDRPIWFAKGQKARVDALQSHLKTDYVFVVWTDSLNKVITSSNSGTRVSYTAVVIGNLCEYPRGKVIGFSNFGSSRGQSCCLFGKSEGDDINELLKDSAAEMADQLMSVAKAEKK